MERSRQYSKRVGKVFKKNFDKNLDSFKGEFLPIFSDLFSFVSEDVAEELFNRFVTYSVREYKDAVYNLVNVFELFEENYDMDGDPLNDEEWSYLKLIINDSSDSLEMDQIKYIMQVMLDLNRI